MRYTFHGGGPCDGALNGAVMPDPLSSGSAGQPLSAHAFAIRATAPGSVTRAASPSITTSASRTDTAIEHRGSRATLRPFRVPAPVWNQNVPSSHRAPTAVTCGLPSSLTVDSQVVREFTVRGRDTSGPTTDEAMTRSEERLHVGTENVQTGRARLRKYVVTETVTTSVPVSHEEVRLEREPITEANRDAALSGPAISEEEHEVTLHAERPVVAKEAVPVGRVRLGTETVTEEQQVSEQVRKEQIDEPDVNVNPGDASR